MYFTEKQQQKDNHYLGTQAHYITLVFLFIILAQKLLHLSYMWFGTREECASMETEEEELQVFDILEKNVFYGMTGKFGPETDEQALDLRSDILKEEEWENRMEKRALFYRRLREFFSLVRRQLKELYDIWFSR